MRLKNFIAIWKFNDEEKNNQKKTFQIYKKDI
jgi:hypothetical protein